MNSTEHKSAFKVLVVDDTSITRQGVLIALNLLGVSADEAACGQDALRQMESSNYDLVLMDYHMPDMTGIECSHHIKLSKNEAATNVPVVLFSSSDELNIEQRCLDAGMSAFLRKDCSMNELRDAVYSYKRKAS